MTRLGAASSTCSGRSGRATAARRRPAIDHLLDRLIHLYALNRGVLLTPFHNMALMSPATTEADVDRHTEVFAAAAAELVGGEGDTGGQGESSAVDVPICDVGPRDGLQNEPEALPPETRAELVTRLAAAGVPRIEAVSFVRDDRVPQMAERRRW